MTKWSPDDSEALYNVPNWGNGFFSIGANGNVEVKPDGDGGPTIDLPQLIRDVLRRGVPAPLLVRFDGILRASVRKLNEAFDRAREEFGYTAAYRGVFPIKVNQERAVVESLLQEGARYGMGLEVGSKPELVAGIALQAGEGSLLICNGYKDEEYVEMALLSGQLGITPIIVIEKFTELQTVLDASKRLGIRPVLGVRCKFSFRGSGRWSDSVGDRSKFGLTTREMVRLVESLREHDMLDCLELLHFHIGSQITHIRSFKQAMREATNVLTGLTQMGVKIRWFDAGGGLGVDYDGSSTNFESSRNYSLEEYANDLVWHLREACREAEIPEPVIVTESGRALVAHHAVLVAEVVGVSGFSGAPTPTLLTEGEPDLVKNLADLARDVTQKNYLEVYHDAVELREEMMLQFNTGNLSLEHRARAEELYWRTCEAVKRVTRSVDYVPEDLEHLERDLADTYFLNFSMFQSVPDAWAIRQLFPILPIGGHRREPTRRAILADLTCDSDGKIDRFIDLHGVKRTLELHPVSPDEPYYLGFFLVGAYQEILGDMHNLFGDTNIVHIDLDGSGRPRLVHVQRGDRVKDVLAYVEYFEGEVLRSVRRHMETSVDEGRMSYEESALFWRRYEAALHGQTYLTRKDPPTVPDRPMKKDQLNENPTGLSR